MAGGETRDVAGVVGDDGAAPEPNGSGDNEGIDRQLTPSPGCGQQVAGDACHPGTGGYDLGETASKKSVDRFVCSTAAVQLDEHGRWYPDRDVSGVGGSHGRPNKLMACGALMRTSER